MDDTADPASRELGSTHTSVVPADAPTSWEPYEVWLTRIKVPRDSAAMRTQRARARTSDDPTLL